MALKPFLAGCAAFVLAASPAFAQHEPGAGAPGAPDGAPFPPNGSIAPSAIPAGANMGTKASASTNAQVSAGGVAAEHRETVVRKGKAKAGATPGSDSTTDAQVGMTPADPATGAPPTTH